MKAIFLSDIHLGASYIPDRLAHEKKVCEFLIENSDADHLYLLGDILDYWFEYRNVVPRGFVRFFGTLATLADKGVKITWLTGNHDIWLFDYLKSEIGIEVIDAPYIVREIFGHKFILTHGDRVFKNDFAFRVASKIFRNRLCQRLYAAIHPRWTVPFALKWSASNRVNRISDPTQEKWQRDQIFNATERLIKEVPDAEFVIMGHHHMAIDSPIPHTNARLIVLGDWIDKFTYATFSPGSLTLLTH